MLFNLKSLVLNFNFNLTTISILVKLTCKYKHAPRDSFNVVLPIFNVGNLNNVTKINYLIFRLNQKIYFMILNNYLGSWIQL